MVEQKQFLNRDITIRKIDSTFIRGICVNESELGVTLSVRTKEGSQKLVFVPFSQINEIVTGGYDYER
jgi:hypothetical protein